MRQAVRLRSAAGATAPWGGAMSVPFLLAMRGDLVIEGKRPDGDSMRFIPADPSQLDRLERADRIDVSQDGSVQLRFEAIDAPETHYGTLAQPLGAAARDQLVALAGFSDVHYSENGTVTARARRGHRPEQARRSQRPPRGLRAHRHRPDTR